MFDETLLDSSPKRVSVLTSTHWLISIGVGLLGFLAWYFGVGSIFTPESTKVLVTQAVIFGAAPFFLWALMLCYVYADTRHVGLSTWLWLLVVLVLHLLGFILYLVYSAAKTDNWKRATLPLAYIFEALLIGVTFLIPLIYTEALPKAQLMTFLAAPPPPPPPPPPPAAAPPKVVVKRVSVEDMMKAPTVIPKSIKAVKDEPEPPPQAAAGVVEVFPEACREEVRAECWVVSSAVWAPVLHPRHLLQRQPPPNAFASAARWNRPNGFSTPPLSILPWPRWLVSREVFVWKP